jgi:hypothetical protein
LEWEDQIKVDLQEVARGYGLIDLAQDKGKW